ncbi:DUF4181 domain-containing protein [Bacillus sp. REN10]|uniref:DUF4181 domain-containing protein n=1 Tax=Bacillus sp. REN10 TaxID=2782541 RepID=UPI00193BF4D7|nr:DUF4181 domain-containing protein [Bacillus sp. REN10]
MSFTLFLGLLIVAMINLHYIEKILIKKYNIPKKQGFFYHYVHTQHKIIEIFLWLLYILGTMFLYLPEYSFIPSATLAYSPLAFLIMMHLLRAFMEWKYERETNRYRLSLAFVAYLLFLTLLLVFILERV